MEPSAQPGPRIAAQSDDWHKVPTFVEKALDCVESHSLGAKLDRSLIRHK
jgi:hypothetical protein